MRFTPMLLIAFVVVGCSSADPASQPEATVDPKAELRAWAGEVCTSADLLEASVASIATSIEIDPLAGLDNLPQIAEQVGASLDEVESRIDDLQGVLNRAPASSSEAQAFADEVDTLVTASRTSGEQAIAGLQEAMASQNIFSAGIAVAAAATSARDAQSDARAAVTLMDQTRSSTTGPLGEAFSTAPECSTASG